MHLVYPTSFYKWDIHDSYSYTRPVRAMHDSYESALALRVLFYFLRSLYVCSSPYSTRDTHYRLINILLLGYYCVSHIRITWLYQHNASKCFIYKELRYKIYKCLCRADIKAIKQAKEVLELSENDNL
jgi:hypothetical protein